MRRTTAALIITSAATLLLGPCLSSSGFAPDVAPGPGGAAPASIGSGAGAGSGVGATYTARLRSLPKSAEVGDKLKLTGQLKPYKKANLTKVLLQRRFVGDAAWTQVAVLKPTPRGKIAYPDPVKDARSRDYRVIVMANKSLGIGSGMSNVVRVAIYQWKDLTAFPVVSGDGVAPAGTVSIQGVTYPPGLVLDPSKTTGYVEYKVAKACTDVAGTAGQSDAASAADAAGTVAISADGVAKYSFTFGPGQAEDVVRSLVGADVVRIALTRTSSVGQPAIGAPQVRCLV